MKGNSHESFEGHVEIKTGSDRSFGLVVGGVLALIGAWPLLGAHAPRWWAIAPGALLILFAAVRPDVLKPLNRLWFKLGLLLGRIVSPVVLGIVYFLWITPIALIMRFCGKRFLSLDFEPDAESYWIARVPVKHDPARMRRPY